MVNLNAAEASGETPERAPDSKQPSERPQPTQPAAETPQPAQPVQPLPPPPIVSPAAPAAPAEQPQPATPRIGVRIRDGQASGPPNTGGSSSAADTARVGTAPNGEPLYAAAWYREPTDAELRGYLSTADGPGWGLIACRTAPDYRVEDCVALEEYPAGSQINRAVLAAAWQFRVRAPRVGGKSLVGSWVRIRIDYGIKRR